MNTTHTQSFITQHSSTLAQLTYRVFGLMSVGLALTGLVAAFVYSVPGLSRFIFLNDWFLPVLFLSELALVFVIGIFANKMHYLVSGALFLLYSVLNGVFFSIVFLVYTATSIAVAFGLTAGIFAVMSLYGFATKQDLTRWGQIAIMGLFASIITSIVNVIFFSSDSFAMIMNYVVIAIFVVLIAYDTQKIKTAAAHIGSDTNLMNQVAVQLALELYLDFINLFIRILRIMGKRK